MPKTESNSKCETDILVGWQLLNSCTGRRAAVVISVFRSVPTLNTDCHGDRSGGARGETGHDIPTAALPLSSHHQIHPPPQVLCRIVLLTSFGIADAIQHTSCIGALSRYSYVIGFAIPSRFVRACSLIYSHSTTLLVHHSHGHGASFAGAPTFVHVAYSS